MKKNIIQRICFSVLICFTVSLTQLHAQTPRDTTVTIKGKKFAPGVEVYYDSAGVRKQLAPSRVNRIDSKTIESMIPGWLLNVPGRYPITVQNPSPSRGVSNSDTLTISQRIVRTDTALWFRFTSNDRYWHEYISGNVQSFADSIFLLTSGNPIIENYSVNGIFFRNGSFQLIADKSDDPIMAKYALSSINSMGGATRIEIDGTSSPIKANIKLSSGETSQQILDLPSFKPFIDALAVNIVKEYPNTLKKSDTTQTKILLALANTEGHIITPIAGQGRFKITINAAPTNLLGFEIPPNRSCIIRIDTEKNYIESIELRANGILEQAIYQKLYDNSQPNNPRVEMIMTEQYYTLPDSDIKMKFVHTKQYLSFENKNYITLKPIILETR